MENRDRLYDDTIATYGAALQRLAKGYEADPDLRKDLLQQIYIAIWRSFASYDGLCSLRTWVYRVAHNAAATHVLRGRRNSSRWVSLEALEMEPGFTDGEAEADRAHSLTKLIRLIANLKPLDRQTFLLYLEGETAPSIAEITGLSAPNVATKLHRLFPGFVASWWGGGPVAVAKRLSIEWPTLLHFQESPGPLIGFALLLAFIWVKFGSEASAIQSEIEALSR